MDRFDIHIDVPRMEWEKLASDRLGEPSAQICARVEGARRIQQGRFEHLPHVWCDADMGVGEIRQFCRIETESQLLLRAAVQQMQLSAWGYHRVLKLARTIADLDGKLAIGTAHVAEALQYRRRRVL